jgi:hypothetical protein
MVQGNVMAKLKKWLMYLVVGFFALGILGSLLPQEQQTPVKKELIEPTSHKKEKIDIEKMTLKNYKVQDEKTQILLSEVFIKSNKWDEKLKDSYKNCMDEFTRTKNEDLYFSEVIQWCNKKLELPREEPLVTVNKLNNVSDVMEQWGGNYDIKTISNNSVVLYIKYHSIDESEWIKADIHRAFIDTVYQTFLYTDFKTVTIEIVPTNIDNPSQTKVSYKGSVKKEDAIKVMKNTLSVSDIKELYKIGGSSNRKFDQARYNDQGGITLNVFFQELSKVAY